MQLTARLRSLSRRVTGARPKVRGRHLALASVAMFAAQCAPQQCAPTPAPAPAPAGYFGWIGLGGALPSDAQCAAAVRRGQPEVRPNNTPYNTTTWSATSREFPRATGNFTGTTDEIIQWAACKWGFDEDTLRAQVAKESYWSMLSVGDNGESFGLMQVREPYFRDSIEGAKRSSAYNLDVALNVWRNCYEGRETWLNDVDRGRQYGAGDAWGCIGRWFSGRWYTPASNDYVAAVQDYLNRRIWTDPGFVNWRP